MLVYGKADKRAIRASCRAKRNEHEHVVFLARFVAQRALHVDDFFNELHLAFAHAVIFHKDFARRFCVFFLFVLNLQIQFGRANTRQTAVGQIHPRQKAQSAINGDFEIAFFNSFSFKVVFCNHFEGIILHKAAKCVRRYTDFHAAVVVLVVNVYRQILFPPCLKRTDKLHQIVEIFFI